jgi:hypothetical protein
MCAIRSVYIVLIVYSITLEHRQHAALEVITISSQKHHTLSSKSLFIQVSAARHFKHYFFWNTFFESTLEHRQHAGARPLLHRTVLLAAAAAAAAVLSLIGSVQPLRAGLSRHAAVLFCPPHQPLARAHLAVETTVESNVK